jgi:DNA-binding HxlR family transcriptional regulator
VARRVVRPPSERSSFSDTLAALNRRHVLTLLLLLDARSPQRFTELQDGPAQLAPKMLARRLEELVGLGLVERRAFRELPPRVEYSLTRKGQELIVVYRLLYGWHLRHGGPAIDKASDERLRLGLAGPVLPKAGP